MPSNKVWNIKEHNESGQQAVSLTPDILKILEETREWAMWELDDIWQYSNENTSNSLNKSEEYWLERENFRVDSTWWPEKTIPSYDFIPSNEAEGSDSYREVHSFLKVKYHLNGKWEEEIWEYLEGNLKWEQLFTYDAALRETANAWKIMPWGMEWYKICKQINSDISYVVEPFKDILIRETLWIWMCGYYEWTSKKIVLNGTWFWAIWEKWSEDNNCIIRFTNTEIIPLNWSLIKHWYPVRCKLQNI